MQFERPEDTMNPYEEMDALHAQIERLHTILTESGEAQRFRAQIKAAEDRIADLEGRTPPDLEPLPDDDLPY